MKILNVRFRNLNSLVGEWNIDFTHPAYLNDGIFAITGPTGAGKSTILDAICLALYGMTPRLNKMTKSENEIMSRQTGDCFAEVAFETQAGRYRCHWSQHRARKSPQGELQNAKHELSELDTGKILSSSLKGVPQTVESLTHLDFTRFTQAMMLAQGSFAAFLRANDDERAAVLEKITGEGIYSEISKEVHRLTSREEQRLKELQAEAKAIFPMPPEEEAHLAESLGSKRAQESTVQASIDSLRASLKWLDDINQANLSLAEVARLTQELEQSEAAFAPDKQRLSLAVKALELAADYRDLNLARSGLDADSKALEQCRQQLPQVTQSHADATAKMEAARVALELRLKELETQAPIIRQARELDLRISEKSGPISAMKERLAKQRATLDALASKQRSDLAELARQKVALEQLHEESRRCSADAALMEQLPELKSRAAHLTELGQRLTAIRKDAGAASQQAKDAARASAEQASLMEGLSRELQAAQEQLDQQQARLSELLAGEELGTWRQRYNARTSTQAPLERLLDTLKNVASTRSAVADSMARQGTILAEQSAQQGLLVQAEQRVADLTQHVETAESNLTLLAKVESLEKERVLLVAGQACPLCGSSQHPFVESSTPSGQEEAGRRLGEARAALKRASEELVALKLSLGRMAKDLESERKAVADGEARLVQWQQEVGQLCQGTLTGLGLSTSDRDLEATVREALQQNRTQQAEISKLLSDAEAVQGAMAASTKRAERAQAQLSQCQAAMQQWQFKSQTALESVQKLASEAGGQEARQAQCLAELNQGVAAFSVGPLMNDQVDSALKQLAQRRDAWSTLQQRLSELTQKHAQLEYSTEHASKQLEAHQAELVSMQGQLAELEQQRSDVVALRQSLFGQKDPDAEEKLLSGAVAAAQQSLEQARGVVASALAAVERLVTRRGQLEEAIIQRQGQILQLDELFASRLKAAGFDDEQHYHAASLPEAQRTALALRGQELAAARAALEAKAADLTSRLEALRGQNLTEAGQEEVTLELEQLLASQRQLHQETGAIQQRLDEVARVRDELRKKQEEVSAQEAVAGRWRALHSLIGSNDGKKYRNFAQGLTFEVMVSHANRQLMKMTQRYLLVRDKASPLELNVIDNYQGGVQRSTRNLSGGESFMVSLALALGLSQMASRRIRVDSLFLDEGFGTLDDDALETALETLSGLRNEGKVIGVISHVPAMKERISVQIQVTPGKGGRSALAGPGCSASST